MAKSLKSGIQVGAPPSSEVKEPVATKAPPPSAGKAKKEKVVKEDTRVIYPGLIKMSADGVTPEVTVGEGGVSIPVTKKLDAVPLDWDRNKHHQLRPKNFASTKLWHEFRVHLAEEMVVARKQDLADFIAGKTKAPADPAKKASKLLAQLAELAALTGQTLDDLVAASKSKADAE